MLDHANVTWTVKSMREAFADVDVEGSRVVSYLPMAHIAERNVTHYGGLAFHYEVTTCPEPGQVAKYLPHVRPHIFFAVPRVWEKIHAGRDGDGERRPGPEGAARRRARHRAPGLGPHRPRRGVAGRSRRRVDRGRRGPERGARPARTRRLHRRDQRRGADLGRDLRLLPRPRCPAERGLRHERVDRAHDVGPVRDPRRHGRARGAGHGARARRRRRGGVPGRERVPRLPRRAREDGRGARRRRLAPLRRHRRPRRRRLPAHRRPQEGADHHRGRQEHLAGQPRVGAEGADADRSGLRDRRPTPVHERAGGARPRHRAGVGERPGDRGHEPRRARRPLGGPRRGRARGRGCDVVVQQRRAGQEGGDPPRRVAPGFRGADADEQAQAPRHPRQVRAGDRGASTPADGRNASVGGRDLEPVPALRAGVVERTLGALHQLERARARASGSTRHRRRW